MLQDNDEFLIRFQCITRKQREKKKRLRCFLSLRYAFCANFLIYFLCSQHARALNFYLSTKSHIINNICRTFSEKKFNKKKQSKKSFLSFSIIFQFELDKFLEINKESRFSCILYLRLGVLCVYMENLMKRLKETLCKGDYHTA